MATSFVRRQNILKEMRDARVFSGYLLQHVERFPEKRKYQFLRLTLRSIIARISHVHIVYLRTDIKFHNIEEIDKQKRS